MSKQTGTTFQGRHWVLVGIFGFLFLCVAVRATYLHVVQQDFLRKQGDARMLRKEPLMANRGMILDRNGVPLAVSTPVISVWINPRQALAANIDINALAKSLDLNAADLKARLERNRTREFLYLKRHLSPPAAETVLNHDFSGVHGLTEYRRYYPAGEVTAHVVGFTDLDENGKEGIELAFDNVLKGVPGERQIVKNLKGHMVKDLAVLKAPHPGQDIQLSFDSRAQYMAYRELANAVVQHGAKAGYAVAVDIDTGEVLAMVNQPSYNPNNRSKLDPASIRNRAVTDMFEPGSTMKVFTVAAALESGKYSARSLFETAPGTYKVHNKLIRDTKDYGTLDLTGVITKSSNIGTAKIALALPPDTLPTFFSRFGFGKSTGSGFPGESAGRMQPPERWRPVELATMSYGYGLTATALQLAHAYATLAGGGVEKPISLVKVTGPVPTKRVLDEKIAQQLLPMMETVVATEGTAVRAAVAGYRVGGKTGTAHKAKAGGYATNEYMSLFVGVAPASRPKIALAVVIDEPRNGQYYAGLVAAPVFSKIMAEMLRLMNVEPDKSTEHLAEQGKLPWQQVAGRGA